jgi:alpha-glucosidase (family GH31 glycosyl hydrolase)
VVIVDPGIHNDPNYAPFQDGLNRNIFIKKQSGDPFIGKVWPGTTAFPDFLHPNATAYWQEWVQNFLQTVPLDGLWIDMNEISNFCDGDCNNPSSAPTVDSPFYNPGFSPNFPPYMINNCGNECPLHTKTLDVDAMHYGQLTEYDVHNLYGTTETIATRVALENVRGKRALVIARSTFSGQGHHGGHWLGDNWSTFQSMAYSIPGILSMNMFGIAMTGADICGFLGTTTEELCSRWTELGAFYTFSRNHVRSIRFHSILSRF